MDLLDRLLDHDYWATTQLLELSSGLSDAQLGQAFDIGHRTLRDTFEHLIFNIEAWTAEMTRQALEAQRDDRSMTALSDRYERGFAAFAAFARRIRDEGRLDDTFTDEYGYPQTFGGAILHVILHNAEHRSELLHILQRLGMSELPEIDHALWDFKRRGY